MNEQEKEEIAKQIRQMVRSAKNGLIARIQGSERILRKQGIELGVKHLKPNTNKNKLYG